VRCGRPPKLDANRLSGKAGGLGDSRGTERPLVEQGAHPVELLAVITRLAAKVGVLSIGLGVLDSGPLGGFRDLGLGLLGPSRT
jgi:hypothetical protein